MLDVKGLIETGLKQAGAGPVVLAAPFEIPDVISGYFVQSGQVKGIVGESAKKSVSNMPIVGYWNSPDYSRLRLIKASYDTLLFLGSYDQIGGRILAEAVRKGIRRIVHLNNSGDAFITLKCRKHLWKRVRYVALRRVQRYSPLKRVVDLALSQRNISFESGFEDLLKSTEFLRLPRESFEQKRALLFSGSLGPGGAERQIANTIRGIATTGSWRVGAACENLAAPLGNFYESSVREVGADVHVVPMLNERFRDPRIQELQEHFRSQYGTIGLHHVLYGVLAYAFFLQEQRPGLVHTWMDASNIRVGLAAVIVGVPAIVLSGRSVAPDHFQIFQPYMRAGYRALLKQRRVTFLNNSRAGAKDYARWLQIPADAIEIIHNGFEFPENVVSIRAATRAQLGLKENDILLGGVLRFSEEKRPDLWVEVAQRFVKADPSYRAICFGDGPMREALLSKIERAGLGGRIQLPGIVNKAWEALSAFDLFLLSSRMEGLPNVLVEAQAAGLPVISPDVGGAAETFLDQDTGLLVPNDSPTELAKACLELARDRDRRAGMGRRAAAYARQEFSAERMVERTRAVYEGAGSMWEG